MSEASQPINGPVIETQPEASLPAPRELMRSAWNGLKSDEGIYAAGTVGGALAGFTVAVTVEGMPINGDNNGKSHDNPARTETGQSTGAPPMVEHSHLQEGTIAGLTILGVVGAAVLTRARRRMHNRATRPIDSN